MIGLDLTRSDDHIIESLEKWLRLIYQFSTESKSKSARYVNNEALETYIREIKSGKIAGDAGSDSFSVSATSSSSKTSSSSVPINIGIPIIVVGCKADVLATSTDTSMSLGEIKSLQGRLRAYCHLFGASLVYASAESGSNVPFLRKCIFHRLHPNAMKIELAITVKLSSFNAFNPLHYNFECILLFITFSLSSTHHLLQPFDPACYFPCLLFPAC